MDGDFDFSDIKADAGKASGGGSGGGDKWKDWVQLDQIPQGAPELPESLIHRCTPEGHAFASRFPYPDADGFLMCEAVRYNALADPEPGKKRGKQFKHFTLWFNPATGELKWRAKGLPEPRPLFGLDMLAAMPDAPVLIVEGEKKVLAARKLFPDRAIVSPPNGASSADKADWRPTAGRDTDIWPDNDKSGAKFAREAAAALYSAGAASVRVVRVPADRLGKWCDLADGIPEGFTEEDLRAWLEAAEPVEPEPADAKDERKAGWAFGLIMTKDGDEPRAILANAIHALRHAPEWDGVLWYNEFANVVVARKPPPWITDRAGWADAKWTDRDDGLVAEWMQRQEIFIPREVAGQAVGIVAGDRKFHPVREYLDSLQWDGTPRIDRWLPAYLGADDTTYARAVGSRWLISAVARIYQPGVKADCALILEGPQGIRKSSALAVLGGEWFSDHISDFHSKDAAMESGRAWIMEIAELDAMSRSDVSAVKAFMSRSVDIFRPPYGKRVIEVPRQCVLAGSINKTAGEGYLKDPTGGRRFWPVTCTFVDLDALRRDRDQMWAEARERYRAGSKWWLETRDLEALAAEQQADRYQSDAWETKINKWLEYEIDATSYDFNGEIQRRRPEPLRDVSIAEIMEKALGIAPGRWTQADQNRVVRVLASMGFEQYRARRGNLRERRYRRIPPLTGRPDGAAQADPVYDDDVLEPK